MLHEMSKFQTVLKIYQRNLPVIVTRGDNSMLPINVENTLFWAQNSKHRSPI